jgi:hypothetical protein
MDGEVREASVITGPVLATVRAVLVIHSDHRAPS